MANKPLNRTFCVAPMMDWTDRFCRAFHRCMTEQALLYTEMVTTGAILHGDRPRHLAFAETEHPVALQLGGSNKQDMAECARIAEDFGYDEININVGCPSDRVQNGRFGACLMAEPHTVAECVNAMQNRVKIPVTVKCRIGIDDQDDYPSLFNFVETVSQAGAKTFIIHARKAWLKGLSPKENRDIPPLDYDLVYQIKQDFPDLEIIINGGITSLEECTDHLKHVDGVMLGREAYTNPFLLTNVDSFFYNQHKLPMTRLNVLERYMEFMERELIRGTPLKNMTRHILGLYNGQPGARAFRRYISENAFDDDAGIDVLRQALTFVEDNPALLVA